MKLSPETLVILKNFAAINNGVEIKQGFKQSTISSGKTVLAKTTLKDEFPEDFCIYDLPQFLSVYSLYKDVEIEFDEFNVIFKSGKAKIKYRKTDKKMIITPPDKELKLPSEDVVFSLSESIFSSIMKSANILQSPNISVESTGDVICITAKDKKDDSAHTNSIEVCEGNGHEFEMVFLTENLKMIPGTYDVSISSKGLASFKNTVQELDYFVATESKDSFFN